MSPSWRDRIEVFLAPDRVDLTRIARGWRPRPGTTHSQPCEAPADPYAADANAANAVAALVRALAELAWSNANAVVTLSGHFVRLALVPNAAAARGSERAALARHQLRLVYGERADGWEVVFGDAGLDAGIAAAADPALVAAVREALAASGIALAGLRPFLAQAFDAARPHLPIGPAWFAAVEPGRVCVAHLDGPRWLALRSQRATGAPEAALARALEQTRLAGGIEADAGEVCVVARDPWPAESAAGRWRIRPVPASIRAAA